MSDSKSNRETFTQGPTSKFDRKFEGEQDFGEAKKPYFSLMIIPNLHFNSVRRYLYQVSNKTIRQI